MNDAEFSSARRPTNVEIVTDIMTFSRFGVLSQLFVIDALAKHATAVAEASADDLASMRNGLVSPKAWQGVAREIAGKLDSLYGRGDGNNLRQHKYGEEPERRFLNRYSHCGQEWEEVWDCGCNDRCPVCNAEIEPFASEEIVE